MKYFHYVNVDGGLIRIKAKSRPTYGRRPRSGCWVVREFDGGKWVMPCFPEIRWKTLSSLEYLGSVPITLINSEVTTKKETPEAERLGGS